VLVGEPGVGKPCVPRALRHRIPAAGFRLTYCHNATLGRGDFYRQLCLALGLSPAATAGALFYAVSRHVEERAEERIHPLVPPLHSRLHHRLEIAPPTPDDTAEYLRLRLRRAGCDRELFAHDATALMHEATAGAMRDLDRLAAAALRETARRKRKLVERDTIARVIEEDTARERDR
jgi:general secretion pathway protein A